MGRSSTAFSVLKIAVVAPIPSASVAIAASGNAGALRRLRIANRTSCSSVSMAGAPRVQSFYGALRAAVEVRDPGHTHDVRKRARLRLATPLVRGAGTRFVRRRRRAAMVAAARSEPEEIAGAQDRLDAQARVAERLKSLDRRRAQRRERSARRAEHDRLSRSAEDQRVGWTGP